MAKEIFRAGRVLLALTIISLGLHIMTGHRLDVLDDALRALSCFILLSFGVLAAWNVSALLRALPGRLEDRQVRFDEETDRQVRELMHPARAAGFVLAPDTILVPCQASAVMPRLRYVSMPPPRVMVFETRSEVQDGIRMPVGAITAYEAPGSPGLADGNCGRCGHLMLQHAEYDQKHCSVDLSL